VAKSHERERPIPNLVISNRTRQLPVDPCSLGPKRSWIQECQEVNLEPEGRACQASTAHRHHLVCRPPKPTCVRFLTLVISRFFWSAVFSACYILGGIVVESPGCPLAPAALLELERTITFYEEGSTTRIPSTTVSTPYHSATSLFH